MNYADAPAWFNPWRASSAQPYAIKPEDVG